MVYNIRPIGCKNLRISNTRIIGCWSYNSDGIDMHNCIDVTIDNCLIRTFDDSICVKGFDCYYEGDVEAAAKKLCTETVRLMMFLKMWLLKIYTITAT